MPKEPGEPRERPQPYSFWLVVDERGNIIKTTQEIGEVGEHEAFNCEINDAKDLQHYVALKEEEAGLLKKSRGKLTQVELERYVEIGRELYKLEAPYSIREDIEREEREEK